jgi:hypothetical protein
MTPYIKLPNFEFLHDCLEIDETSPSGLRWKNPNKYSNKKKGDVAGNKTDEGYWRVRINYIKYTAHRIIFYMKTGEDPGDYQIDHAENRSNNFKIRKANSSQNQANTKKKPGKYSSKYKGVSFAGKMSKWKSGIMVKGKSIHLGYFVSEVEAAEAYNKAALEYFGEFAGLNDLPKATPDTKLCTVR